MAEINKTTRKKTKIPAIDAAFCPCCGKQIHQNRATERVKGITVERQEYFSSIPWNPDQPFGMRRPTTGKASFAAWVPITPEDNPALFNAVKTRFITAVKEWQARGWIKPEDFK